VPADVVGRWPDVMNGVVALLALDSGGTSEVRELEEEAVD
jgi:hypothetical protein